MNSKGDPLNQLLNEAIKIYLGQQSPKEASLERVGQRFRIIGSATLDLSVLTAAFVDAEARFEDPVEGKPVEGQFVEGSSSPPGQCSPRSASFSVPEWDKDSPRLRANLVQVLKEIVLAAERREIPTLEAARPWHSRMMEGLDVPNLRYVGVFRGEPGLQRTQVKVGASMVRTQPMSPKSWPDSRPNFRPWSQSWTHSSRWVRSWMPTNLRP